ncbi:MAG: GNAT family N-acetyltransferase [Gemmatimonadaceae bacterium]
MPLAPLSLHGTLVSLEQLTRSHLARLTEIGFDPELWRLQPPAIIARADMEEYVDEALADQLRDVSRPFVIVRRDDNTVIRSTRFMDIALPHRRLEIGATWLARSAQRTGAKC